MNVHQRFIETNSPPELDERWQLTSLSSPIPCRTAPPDWMENIAPLRKLHEFIYPSGSKWYWYRRAKVNHTVIGWKYVDLVMHLFLGGLLGSGLAFPVILTLYAGALRAAWDLTTTHQLREGTLSLTGLNATEIATSTARPEWYPLAQTPLFVFAQCFASATITCLAYYTNATYLINKYYVGRKDDPENWKCQPDSYLTVERAREEKLLGCFNAFVAGFFGTGLYFVHLNYPVFKLYYETETRGLAHFFLTAVVCYLWIDFYSYWAHRALHTKWLYKNVHKVHHRYVSPTPFSAFALHPVEFVIFQSAGIIQLCFIETHVIGYLAAVLFVAYHNQVDHSGIDFEGGLPWMPTTKYHDDHHLYFHLNFGLHFVSWDWLGGTLRSKERAYGEDVFVGEQDRPSKEIKAE